MIELPDRLVQQAVEALPSDVRLVLALYPLILAGGFLRDAVTGDRPNDIDLFGDPGIREATVLLKLSRGVPVIERSRQSSRQAVDPLSRSATEVFYSSVNEIPGDPAVQLVGIVTDDTRWREPVDQIARSGLLRLGGPLPDSRYRVVPPPDRYQVLRDVATDLLGRFDYTAVAAAIFFDGKRYAGVAHEAFLEDAGARHLRLVDPGRRITGKQYRRLHRMRRRGWSTDPGLTDQLDAMEQPRGQTGGVLPDPYHQPKPVRQFVRHRLVARPPYSAPALDPPPVPVDLTEPTLRVAAGRALAALAIDVLEQTWDLGRHDPPVEEYVSAFTGQSRAVPESPLTVPGWRTPVPESAVDLLRALYEGRVASQRDLLEMLGLFPLGWRTSVVNVSNLIHLSPGRSKQQLERDVHLVLQMLRSRLHGAHPVIAFGTDLLDLPLLALWWRTTRVLLPIADRGAGDPAVPMT